MIQVVEMTGRRTDGSVQVPIPNDELWKRMSQLPPVQPFVDKAFHILFDFGYQDGLTANVDILDDPDFHVLTVTYYAGVPLATVSAIASEGDWHLWKTDLAPLPSCGSCCSGGSCGI